MPMPATLLPSARTHPLRSLLLIAMGALAGISPLHAQNELLPPPPSQRSATVEEITPTAEELVLEIRVLGNDTIPLTQIESQISTRVGRPFDQSVVQRDVRQLANLGWFVDVKPLYETTPQGRIVIFKVVERPTIRYVSYLGNEKITDKRLAKETNLTAGGAIDPYSVDEGRRKIVEFYQSKGYNKVQVTIVEGTKATDKGIVYLINEGNFEKVWDVDFVGNEFVSDGRLKTIIESKPPKFLFFKGYVNRKEIDSDVDRLTAYYRSFGYFQARVSRKIDYYPSKKWVHLTYVIHEGLRYKIRDVRFLGNSKFEPVALAEAGKLKSGESFEQAKVSEDQRWIQELYGSRGYVFADIRPETVFLEEPGEVDLIYHIDEGEQFRIGNIYVNIGGDNPHTRIQTILNPMSIRPGDIADIREIKASERRIIARNILETNPAQGVRPKLTYRPSDDQNQYEFANRPRRRSTPKAPSSPPGAGPGGFGNRPAGAGFRGQSPDNLGPPVLPPPSMMQQPSQPNAQAVPTVYRGQSPEQPTPKPTWYSKFRKPRVTQTVRKPENPYLKLRGQSPQPTTQNTYSSLPAGGVPQPQYGGQLVGATGPATNHAVAQNVTPQTGVQPVQYSEVVPPPAGYAGPIPGALARLPTFPRRTFWWTWCALCGTDGRHHLQRCRNPNRPLNVRRRREFRCRPGRQHRARRAELRLASTTT